MEALAIGRDALALLGKPHVVRTNPSEASALSCTTVLVEQEASSLGQSGASVQDIKDALQCIRALGAKSPLAHWIPLLEQRAK